MLYLVISALAPCLSLVVLAICGTTIAIRKNVGQVKVFKLSLSGLEIRFDKDRTDNAQ